MPAHPFNPANLRRFNVMLMLCAASLLAACSDGARLVDEEIRETDATVRIKNFRRQSISVDGTPVWYVKAEEAFLYQEEDKPVRIVAYDFEFEQFNKDGQLSDVMVADRGEIDYLDEMYYLTGNVFYEDQLGDEKRKITAEEIQYDRIEGIMTSEKPLVIEEEGMVTRCTRGAEIDTLNNRQVCKGPMVISVSEEGGTDAADIFN